MIDYYLKKYCCLNCKEDKNAKCGITGRACSLCRCTGCVWLDKDIHKCIFSVNYPKQITMEEFARRIAIVNPEQQKKLSDPKRRFIMFPLPKTKKVRIKNK